MTYFVMPTCYLNVSLSSLITSVGQKRAVFCYQLLVPVASVRISSFSFGCLGKAALFYCGTSLAFHLTTVQTCMPYWLILMMIRLK